MTPSATAGGTVGAETLPGPPPIPVECHSSLRFAVSSRFGRSPAERAAGRDSRRHEFPYEARSCLEDPANRLLRVDSDHRVLVHRRLLRPRRGRRGRADLPATCASSRTWFPSSRTTTSSSSISTTCCRVRCGGWPKGSTPTAPTSRSSDVRLGRGRPTGWRRVASGSTSRGGTTCRSIAVRDGSPAAAAGIAPGDYVRAIDGDPTRLLSVIEGEQRLQRRAGHDGHPVVDPRQHAGAVRHRARPRAARAGGDQRAAPRGEPRDVGYLRVPAFGEEAAAAVADTVDDAGDGRSGAS